MGLTDWFHDTMKHVNNITDDVTRDVTQGAEQFNKFVGQLGHEIKAGYEGLKAEYDKLNDALSISGKVGGDDPAAIYRNFHEGPGTEGYQTVQKLYGDIGGEYEDSGRDIQSAKQTLDSSWQGPAAEKAKAALSKVTNNFDKVAQFSSEAHNQLGGQISTFHETKNRVVKVPDPAPRIGGVPMATPAGPLVAGGQAVQVANYQDKARQNQQAYQAYGGATTPQQQELPTQLITASQPHDTSPGTHATMPGHGGGQSFQYSGGAPAGATAPQQAGAAPAPVHQSTYQAPAASAPQGPRYVNPGATNTAGAGTPVSPTTGGGGYAGGPVAGGYGGSGGGSAPGESQRYTGAVPYESPAEEFAEGSVPRAASGGLSPLAEALGGVAAGGVGAGLGAGAEGESYKRGWRSANREKALTGEEEPGLKSGKGAGAEEPKAGTIEPKPPAEPGARSAARAMAAEERALGESARGAKGAGVGEEMIPPGGAGGKEEDREHKTPSYLVREENGKEIVGELPPTAPPVIGE